MCKYNSTYDKMSKVVASQEEINKLIESDQSKKKTLAELSPVSRRQTQPKNLPPKRKNNNLQLVVGIFGAGYIPAAQRVLFFQ